MLTTVRAKIGFISSSAPSSAHHKSFQAFVPKDVDFTAVQDKTAGDSLYDARGKLDALVGQTVELVEKYAWNGVIISGAPKEVLNPGLWDRLSSALKVPVATALRSSVEALTVLAVKRVLLMTPVDDQLKKLYENYALEFGIQTVYPLQTLRAHTDATRLTPDEVRSMTRDTFAQYPDLDAIYFQGALLDPLPVLERMESELGVPIVASNPAMLWFVLSQLGLRYEISGYGQLLSSWPDLTGC